MEISIENASSKFEEHFSQDKNDRILFSGKFGTGKSYFLKKYFENRDDKYNLFWLSPVNYVVGANQDIFEWIKIDIAKLLVAQDLFSKTKEEFSNNLLSQTYIYNNASSIFKRLMTVIADTAIKIKTGGFSVLSALKEDIENYKKFVKDSKEEGKSHFDKIDQYLNDAFQVKGSIYEDDLTTRIIRASIEMQKYDSGKENILVIDDLDRLDPEHIFRILNILSTHNDHFDTNKFGFDKVIVVCDIDNIKHIYEYKYGEKVDFEGYIEKFFTYEPFYFDINEAIVNYCEDDNIIDILDKDNRQLLAFWLATFYRLKRLKIRNLKKIFSDITLIKTKIFKTIEYTDEYMLNQNIKYYSINLNDYGYVKVLWILSVAFGGIDNLLKELKNMLLDKSGKNIPIQEEYCNAIFYQLPILNHISTSKDSVDNVFYTKTTYQSGRSEANKVIQSKFLGGELKIVPQKISLNGIDYFDKSLLEPVNLKYTIHNIVTSTIFIIQYLKDKQIIHHTNK